MTKIYYGAYMPREDGNIIWVQVWDVVDGIVEYQKMVHGSVPEFMPEIEFSKKYFRSEDK
jgi:hypothetical protein